METIDEKVAYWEQAEANAQRALDYAREQKEKLLVEIILSAELEG